MRVSAWLVMQHFLKSTSNITTYLARDLPHPVIAPAEPLLSVNICMRSLRGKFCCSVCIV